MPGKELAVFLWRVATTHHWMSAYPKVLPESGLAASGQTRRIRLPAPVSSGQGARNEMCSRSTAGVIPAASGDDVRTWFRSLVEELVLSPAVTDAGGRVGKD